MSAPHIKGKLKALKEALAAKEWTAVEKNASEVLSYEAGNYNARVFLSLALFNLERFGEAEESYKKAIEGSPSQTLARQGLASFYEKRLRWSDYAWSLLELMQLFEAAVDAPKYAETLQKLISVRRSHGTRLELISALSHLLPSSPSYPLLSTLPPAVPTAPTASPFHEIQLALLSSLPTLLQVLSLAEAEESSALEAEITKRRQRLGGTTLSAAATRKTVQGELMRGSRLPGLWRAIMEDPDASEREDLRRENERKLLEHLRTLLGAMPSSLDAREVDLKKVEKRKEVKEEEEREKARLRKEVEELAGGMVLLGIPEEMAWSAVLEWSDRGGTWERMDWRELGRYWEIFTESGLARIAKATWLRMRASEEVPEGEAVEPAPTADEMSEIVEKGLAASPDSLLAHLLAVKFFSDEKEWDSVVQVSEAGLSVLEKLEAESGRPLPTSRRTLDSHLAIALAYLDPPSHHLRALRLLDVLLVSSPSAPLLSAKASVLQHAEKWLEAVQVWDVVLSSLPPEDPARTAIEGDRAWCLFSAKEYEEAVEGLENVVEVYATRKGVRDEQQKERKKARSKAGIEKGEGVEEGETVVESEERAKAWWRLGECLWVLGEVDAELTSQAYEAFVSAIRAAPAYAPPFTSLGIYYRSLETPDYDRASKCFQKAFELDGGQEVAARYLAEEFAAISEWDLVEVIARRVVDGNRGKAALGGKAAQRLSWAWKAIGGAELNSKKYPQAIIALQAALRGAPADVHTWIKLGVAYRSSGKYIAALKVFEKALSLDPTSWYAKFSIGDVQREIGLLEPALKTFREILVERPTELGVRVVLAETAHTAGLDEFRGGFLARAEKSFIEALEEALTIIEAGSATRIAWKIAGDALTGLGKIPEPLLLETSKPLALRILVAVEEQGVDVKIEGMDAVTAAALRLSSTSSDSSTLFTAVAVLAFKMRVLLETQNEASIGSAWLDLGVSLSHLRPHLSQLGLPTTSDETLRQAVRCLKFALHKEPVNSIFWNALGVLSFDLSPRLSQHCFIKSIEHNSRSAVPWTNLGLFYLVHGDEDLANQSFLKAQVIDPDWAPAWVGQATLADLAGHLAESSVLLEHAFSLGGSTPEADIGYATRAYSKHRSTPNPPSATAALSAPLFALTRYLSQRPTDPSALHLNALLLEQVGNLPTACESLEKAATILEELYEVDESPQVEGQYVIAQTNLGRVRLASLDYEGALAAFETAMSLLNVDGEDQAAQGGLTTDQSVLLLTECKLGSGLAHFWLGEVETAAEVLEGALEDIEAHQGSRRADIAIAAGKVYWSQGDEDRALGSFVDAPSALLSKAPLFVTLSIQALAIVTSDTAVLNTVKRLENDPFIKFQPEATRLSILQNLAKNNQPAALSAASRTLHATPWVSHSRGTVAQLLFQLAPIDGLADSSVNLDICTRFIRTRLVDGEDARQRSGRYRGAGLVRAAKEGEEEGALGCLEKAVWLAPWDAGLRKDLGVLQAAVED